MKSSLSAATAPALGVLIASSAWAQSSNPPPDTMRMPYQKEFWTTGHLGVEFGRGKFDATCPPVGGCDNKANAGKIFAGGRFNNIVGGEVSYLKTGDFERGTGNINMQAVNFGLLAGVPLPYNSSVFGKLGVLWGHTEAGSDSQNGWGPSFGFGAMIGVARNWALRLDWDRYRFKMPAGGGDHENVDSLMIGAQYTFGGPPR